MNETIKELKSGDTLATKFGAATVVSTGSKASRSGKRTFHAYTIRFEATGKTVTVTRRGLGKMKAVKSTVLSTPTPTPTPTPAAEVGQSLSEWQAARDRLRSNALSSPEPVEEPEPAVGVQGDLAKMLAAMVKPHINAKVSRDEVVSLVKEQVSAMAVQRIEVTRFDGSVSSLGVQHFNFESLLRIAACRLHSYLVGPAGSGKSTAGKAVADALGLKFYSRSVGQQTSEMALLGYMDGKGEVVRTPLREAYEHGGVFLLDEIDSGNAAVLVVLNSLLANGFCSFPDRIIEAHKDFVLLAGANTTGQGGDRQYVGKCQLDATTLDRFVFVDWQWDPHIEASRCGVPLDTFGPRPSGMTLRDTKAVGFDEAAQMSCEAYGRKVYKVRKAIEAFGGAVRHIVGPRTSMAGCQLIRAGFAANDVEEMCIWKGMDKATRAKIESRC